MRWIISNRPQVAFILLLIAVLGFGASQIYRLGHDVRQQLGLQAATDADNIQWNLIQAEVEMLQLQTAINKVLLDRADLTEVRRRYDIFYSRIGTLRESSLYRGLFEGTEGENHLHEVAKFRDDWVSVIDGRDDTLFASLEEFAEAINIVHPEMRLLALDAVRRHASQSDRRRSDISLALWSLAATGLVLVVWLVCVVLLLLGMYRRLRSVSQENARVRGRLEAMVSSSLDAIFVVAPDGEIIDTNGAAAYLFGMDANAIRGVSMWELLRPGDEGPRTWPNSAVFLDTVADVSLPNKDRAQVTGIRASGEVFPVEISVSLSSRGAERVYVAFLRDVSNRVAREADLLRARDDARAGEKAKGRMLSVMSHEMRTPLNGVLGALNLLESENATPKQDKFIQAIRVSSNLLLDHVNDVLELSRLDAENPVLQKTVFSPVSLIRDLVNSQKPAAEAAGNSLDFATALDEEEQVIGDPRLLQNALLNLLGNANKFTKNGEVLVDLDPVPGTDDVEIRVNDTGQGIADADQERIFDEFITLDASFARATEGTGLGLSITRKMVEAMGGEVGVESIENEGSMFWIRLPLPRMRANYATAELSEEEVAETSGSKNILVVEDNEINRMLLQEMLDLDGHCVTTADDGLSGVQMANRKAFDLIFMDISMPGMDGFMAAGRIREEGLNKATRLIAVTAHAADEIRSQVHDAGFDDLITKPFGIAEIRATLGDCTGAAPKGAGQSSLSEIAQILGAERAHEMIEQFSSEMEAFLSEDVATWAQARQTAHRLAGPAGSFGWQDLYDALTAVEASDEASGQSLKTVAQVWQRHQETIFEQADNR